MQSTPGSRHLQYTVSSYNFQSLSVESGINCFIEIIAYIESQFVEADEVCNLSSIRNSPEGTVSRAGGGGEALVHDDTSSSDADAVLTASGRKLKIKR